MHEVGKLITDCVYVILNKRPKMYWCVCVCVWQPAGEWGSLNTKHATPKSSCLKKGCRLVAAQHILSICVGGKAIFGQICVHHRIQGRPQKGFVYDVMTLWDQLARFYPQNCRCE